GQESEARAFGADVVVSGSGDVRAAVRAAREEPFEAVLDVISDADALKRNALLVRPGGRLVTTIHVADVPWFAESGIAATNLSLVDTADYSGRGLDELAKMAVNGTLVVNVAGERSLEEANDLLDGIEAGKISGKFVLRVAGA
ncbi:MAG: zinc-binding dehydrogenase, partial [Candidatus Eremiobacteraeota bacterium]|nr:zinc-binding dehydrogenase [Candidatus Eremiobacteraeota bacterium]